MGGFLRCESGVESGFAQRVSEITDLVANSSANPPASRAAESPFWLGNESGYQAWKRQKLSLRESLDPARTFHLDPNHAADAVQISEMRRQIDGFNFILFGTDSELTRPGFLRLNRAFGLNRLDLNPGAGGDAVTLLQVVEADDPRELKKFRDANESAMAEDHTGAPVFLARNAWHLEKAEEDWESLKFLKTKEHSS